MKIVHGISMEMEPEGGVIHGIADDGIIAFTDSGVENLRELLQIHLDDAARDKAALARNPPMRP